MTEPDRRRERDDGVRFPDPRPFRLIQLATVGLIAVAVVVTLTSGSRPAEVRYGTLVGLAALALVVLWATRRRRARRASPPRQNTLNHGENRGSRDQDK
jgi:membrane protein implicated in regulation of membrane protease activity